MGVTVKYSKWVSVPVRFRFHHLDRPFLWCSLRVSFGCSHWTRRAPRRRRLSTLHQLNQDIDTEFEYTEAVLNYAYYYFDDFLIKKIPPILEVPEEKEDLRKQILTEGKIIKLKNIYFDFDKWDLHPRSFIELSKLITILKKNPSMNIQIHGHTDSIGSDNYNIYLSRKRARSVINYLVDQGIDAIANLPPGQPPVMSRCQTN